MKEESFFLIHPGFIAFERCFIHSVKENCLCPFSSKGWFTYYKSIYQPVIESGRISGEWWNPNAKSKENIKYSIFNAYKLQYVFWMSTNCRSWPIFSEVFRTYRALKFR